MQPGRTSTTAEIMALFRAQESARREPLFNDPFAAGFLGRSHRRVLRLSSLPLVGTLLRRFIDARWPGARTSGIARTRLIDDWLKEAVAAGAEQVLILGAGFDSRAWRLPALVTLPVIEVDHPATCAEKRRRLADMGADLSCIRSVPVDFDRELIGVTVRAAGFDETRPAAIVWEGVTNYLTAQAVDTVVRWIGTLARGTRLIFTYVDEAVLAPGDRFENAASARLLVKTAGEPWTFGFKPAELPSYLSERGLALIEDLDANAYRARVMGESGRRARGYEFYHVALAEVTGTCRS
jgi:methyltransferase (TIGR00027 family)